MENRKKSIYQMENYAIIWKKCYFHTRMLELIIFDSILEENIFVDLVTIV